MSNAEPVEVCQDFSVIKDLTKLFQSLPGCFAVDEKDKNARDDRESKEDKIITTAHCREEGWRDESDDEVRNPVDRG